MGRFIVTFRDRRLADGYRLRPQAPQTYTRRPIMVQIDANLLRTSAAIVHDSLEIVKRLRAINAPFERIADAEQNCVNAGNLLRLAMLRWFRTL